MKSGACFHCPVLYSSNMLDYFTSMHILQTFYPLVNSSLLLLLFLTKMGKKDYIHRIVRLPHSERLNTLTSM